MSTAIRITEKEKEMHSSLSDFLGRLSGNTANTPSTLGQSGRTTTAPMLSSSSEFRMSSFHNQVVGNTPELDRNDDDLKNQISKLQQALVTRSKPKIVSGSQFRSTVGSARPCEECEVPLPKTNIQTLTHTNFEAYITITGLFNYS